MKQVSTPTSLYVHIPFCVRKCEYCDFYSHAAGDEEIDRYLDALERELQIRFPQGFRPATVFLGGGTPTRLSAAQILRLKRAFDRNIDLSRCQEFTCEINPSTLDNARAEALRALGVDRASFGVQSFDPALLESLGRGYESGRAPGAVETARRAGIARAGIDLIFAVPGQTLEGLRRDIHAATEFATEHVSYYALTYEDDTPLTARMRAGEIQPCPEELEREMFFTVSEELARRGLQRYEVSNFARAGCECRHNLVYWRLGEWIGVGAGAHSLFGGEIQVNGADSDGYTRALLEENRLFLYRNEKLDATALAETLLLMGLRTTEGIGLAQFEELAGAPFGERCGEAAALLRRRGLLEWTADRVRATDEGLLLLDHVILELARALEDTRPREAA